MARTTALSRDASPTASAPAATSALPSLDVRASTPLRGWRAWAMSLAAGLLLGMINASQHYLDHVVSDEDYGWGHALAHSVPWWALWGLFTRVIAAMVARYDFSEGSRTHDVAAHAAAAVGLTLLHALLYSSFVALVVTPASDFAAFARTVGAFLSKATLNLFTYAGLAGGLFALA